MKPLSEYTREELEAELDRRTLLDGYNPDFGDDKLCVCGHTYYRHFDTYDDMEPVGCKYCGDCGTFVDPVGMSEHDEVRMRRAWAAQKGQFDEEKYNDAIRGLQSTDDPRLVRLHDRLVWELGVLREGKARSGRD